jgi:alkylation response protein AidB-like acyl-CoA dehydrogenase
MTIRGDEHLKAEHAELVGHVRRFLAEEVAPRAAGIDRENAFPADLYRRMGEEGLLGLARSQGAGKTTLEWAVWIEELAAASATVADIVCSADLVALILDEHGTEEQKSMIGPLLAGETVGAFALTEAQAGSNAAAIETAARREGDSPRQKGLDHLRAGGRLGDRAGEDGPGRRHEGNNRLPRRAGRFHQR